MPFITAFIIQKGNKMKPFFYIKRSFFLLLFITTLSACSTAPAWQSVERAQIGKGPVGHASYLVSAENYEDQAFPIAYSGDHEESAAVTTGEWILRPEGELAPGFHISISGAADSEINDTYISNPRGTLELPYDVRVETSGLTEDQLTQKVREAYAHLLRSPESIKTSVSQKEYWVSVGGLVRTPGSYLVRSDSTLDEIIGHAEGLQETQQSDQRVRYARILHLGGETLVNLRDYYSGTQDVLPSWQGGEQIFFQSEGSKDREAQRFERQHIHMLGQVLSPGEYAFEPHQDISHYLIQAGGPTERADLRRLTILRTVNGGSQRVDFSLDKVGSAPSLQPGDTVIVNADNPTKLERQSAVWAGFASVFSALAAVALIAVAL